MKKPKLRYQEAPVLNVEYSCGGWHCHSSLEFEDGYLCPECGTHFSTPEEPGTPYTEWSGESVEDLPLYDEWGQIVDQEEPEASLSPEDLPAVSDNYVHWAPGGGMSTEYGVRVAGYPTALAGWRDWAERPLNSMEWFPDRDERDDFGTHREDEGYEVEYFTRLVTNPIKDEMEHVQ